MPKTARRPKFGIEEMTTAEAAAWLHEKAIDELTLAIGAIEAGDIEFRCNSVNLTAEAIATLHMAVDYENGGETAERMGAIYRFVLANLIRINLQNDADLAAQIICVLVPLREAWRVAAEVATYEAATSEDPILLERFDKASRSAEAATA